MRRFLTVLVLSLTPGFVLAQSADPAWLDLVREQAAAEEQCDVTLIVSMREYELGGRHVEEARLRCADGRMFDASRAEPDDYFTLKACEIQVC